MAGKIDKKPKKPTLAQWAQMLEVLAIRHVSSKGFNKRVGLEIIVFIKQLFIIGLVVL
ncbi:hypothetical protein GCM10009129_17690 [Psychrobacter aestuarii]|uniref:Uncharacterized protein n=1 Tax=Psychrobacter aestuarii TaxID=556327 RepID=A0ABN0VYT0_9GAMM